MNSGEPKRILYVSPFDEPVSGADESLLLAIAALDRNRYAPHILLHKDSKYIERYKNAGAEVYFWPLSRMRRSFNPFYWLQFLSQLRNEIRLLPFYLIGKEISLVHINMHVALGPAIAARKIGIPVVIHYRAKTNDTPKVFFDWFLPKVHQVANHIFAISGQVADHFHKRNLSENISILYNPVDLKRFDSIEHDSKEIKIILFVGRIDPQKRVHVFLDAIRRLVEKGDPVRGVVMGDVAEKDIRYATELRPKAEGLPVDWIVGRRDVENFYKTADVFAFPAVHEGFGRVLVEAMASGVPIVGVDSGATSEILEWGKWGEVVVPEDPAILAQAIRKAWSDPKSLERAVAARKHAKENFSVSSHVSKLMDIYDQLLR